MNANALANVHVQFVIQSVNIWKEFKSKSSTWPFQNLGKKNVMKKWRWNGIITSNIHIKKKIIDLLAIMSSWQTLYHQLQVYFRVISDCCKKKKKMVLNMVTSKCKPSSNDLPTAEPGKALNSNQSSHASIFNAPCFLGL